MFLDRVQSGFDPEEDGFLVDAEKRRYLLRRVASPRRDEPRIVSSLHSACNYWIHFGSPSTVGGSPSWAGDLLSESHRSKMISPRMRNESLISATSASESVSSSRSRLVSWMVNIRLHPNRGGSLSSSGTLMSTSEDSTDLVEARGVTAGASVCAKTFPRICV